MIYTLTLNPSVDYVVRVQDFKEGHLNRTGDTSFYAGGKGINVSRVLQRLTVENTALGFLGGFTGDFIKNTLTKEGINSDFIAIEDNTRINVKLKSAFETEINGEGPQITSEHKASLLKQIDALQQGDILVLSGSIPSSLGTEFYMEAAKHCQDHGVDYVLDSSGQSFMKALQYEPFLVKPNHHELGELFSAKVDTVEQAVHYGKKLLLMGPQHVIVSMGGKGAVLVAKDIALFAEAPKGVLKNSVGAGDSVVAGFIAGFKQTNDIKEAFVSGVAAGSATAFSDDLCSKQQVEELKSQIQIHTI
ncbi:1-phosphofructokinase [Bacillus sp. HMF5848]|uniref:1-phosphofructokinase n=1 Tax=Bacillus sp. HMF5848 TaxID=2495421 RepID=UPI000F7974BA|nr:1-phosphofructokinase [Bacillus sp. HMF5848]RSK28483.1 1-phosphofructokinase [Bacillus sp. HMF5848]